MTAAGGAADGVDARAGRRGGSRRTRRRGVAVAAAALVAWFAGKGLMLTGREPSPGAATAAAGAAGSPRPVEPAAGDRADGVPDRVPSVVAPPARPEVEAKPAEPADAGATSIAMPVREAVAPPDPDRFAALSSALTVHTERDEVAAAFAALAHLRGLSLSAAQQAAADGLAAALQTAVAGRLSAVDEALAAGRGRAAADAFRPIAEAAATADAWLHQRLVESGWTKWRREGLVADAALPAPRPLARGRAVAASTAEGGVRGVVVAADAGECTLRVESSGGVAFPTVPMVACEPESPSGDEAIDLALAAARHGDVVLARSWAFVALRRGGDGLARWPRLRAALP